MNNGKYAYTHVFVDWDGTLQNTIPTWLASTMLALSERDISLEEGFVAQHIISHLSSAKEYGVTDIDDFVASVVANSKPHLPECPMDMGLWTELVKMRDSGTKIAIVTTAYMENIQNALNYHQLKGVPFDHIIGSDIPELNGKIKPDPTPLAYAMQLMGSNGNPTRPLMVGDSKSDILAGQAYGCDTLLYYPPRNEISYELQSLLDLHPTYCARSVDELREIVLAKS